MRITRDALLKLARETVNKRTHDKRNVLAAYLCGSVLGEDFMVGGTADIDLVFIHLDEFEVQREIIPLSEDVHLDIAHHHHAEYRHARQLREHPWLGPTLNDCKILYDPQHFMDFTQASVRGQFDRPDHAFARARKQSQNARQAIEDCANGASQGGPEDVKIYLRGVAYAANAIALIVGRPLTERRFLLHFQQRALTIGKVGLYAGLLGLLGAPQLPPNALSEWLPRWQAAYRALPEAQTPPRLHAERRNYYQRALDALASSDQPAAFLWPMLNTWTQAVVLLQPESAERVAWQTAFKQLGLASSALSERVEALEAFLDTIDEILENWARKNGVWPE